MKEKGMDHHLVSATAEIIAAYLSRNTVAESDVPALIRTIYQTLEGLAQGAEPQTALKPAVPISQSVMPDYLVCLEDGKKMKMLKRYLKTAYGLTPDEYRRKWGLPSGYPMVAPNYAKKRSRLAKAHGLGAVRG